MFGLLLTLDTHSSDYITEKVYEVLEAGAVPVYLGAPNWQDCECPSKSAHTHTHTHTCLRAHVCVTGFWLLLPLSLRIRPPSSPCEPVIPLEGAIIDAGAFDSPHDLAEFLKELAADDARYQVPVCACVFVCVYVYTCICMHPCEFQL